MKVTGIATWAHIQAPSKELTFEKKGKKTTIPSRYSIDVILSKEDAKELHSKGYNVKKVKNEIPGLPDSVGQPFINIKKAATYKDGAPVKPPKCVDAKKRDFTGLIGNGSTVNVIFDEVPYELMGKEGISCRLKAVQVLKLVSIERDGLDELDEEEGFEAPKDSSSAPKKDVEEITSSDDALLDGLDDDDLDF